MKAAAISNHLLSEAKTYSTEILKGLTAGVSHFHAVGYIKDQLKGNGFIEIHEQDKWALEGGKSYFCTRNHSTIIAWTLGKKV
jgi:aspartyl aminopeptidase